MVYFTKYKHAVLVFEDISNDCIRVNVNFSEQNLYLKSSKLIGVYQEDFVKKIHWNIYYSFART